jgi:hypothetical protein
VEIYQVENKKVMVEHVKSSLYRHRNVILLKQMCDGYLCSKDTRPARVAIDVLHFISQHYVHLAKYNQFLKEDDTHILSKIRNRLYLFARLFKISTRKEGVIHPLNDDAMTSVIVFSHLNNIEALDSKTDFYFGELRDHLEKSGLSVRYVYLNKTNSSTSSICQAFRRLAPRDILLLNKFSTRTLYRAIRSLLIERRAINGDLATETNKARKRFLAKLAGNVFDLQSIRNYAVYLQFLEIVARYKPETVFCTFEGHAFERLVFHASRSIDQSTRCIGYQHTLVYQFQHALCRSIGLGFDPDVILTSGDLSRSAISNRLESDSGIDVITAGTIRAAVKNKKFGYSADQSACLVAPDGTLDECELLFRFAISAAVQLENIEFLFRVHPIVSFRLLRKRGIIPETLPANVTLSSEPMEFDLSRCSWLLYRSSSVAVAGLYSGLRPLYMNDGHGVSVDPLFALTQWKQAITSVDELRSVIRSDIKKGITLLEREWCESSRFRDDYFHNMNYQVFIDVAKARQTV